MTSAESIYPDRTRWTTAAAWLVLAGALAALFGHTFGEMWLRWFPAWQRHDLGLYGKLVQGESYYTHGPLVPLLSGLIIFLLIRHTRIETSPGGRWGWPVLAASVLLHLAACLARVTFASGFAMIGVLIGLVLIFWGRPALGRLWFPIALLAFMIPLPEVVIADLNFRLKILAASSGLHLAAAAGVAAQRAGNRVIFPNGSYLIVANACNGLRTLISLLAFGALYAYICRLRGVLRIALFLMTAPVALVSNAVRIASLIVVANIWGVRAASGAYHDISSMLIFVLAFLLMFLVERLVLGAARLLGRPIAVMPLFYGRRRMHNDDGQWPRMTAAAATARGLCAIAILALAAGAAWRLGSTVSTAPTQADLDALLPARLVLPAGTFESNAIPLDDATLTILEYPSYFYREYTDDNLPPIDYCVLFSKDNRKGIHPPDLCLEGGDTEILARNDVDVPGGPADLPIPCRELVVQEGNEPCSRCILYTYKCGHRYTRSFWAQQMGIFGGGLLGRSATGALIRLETPAAAGLHDAERRLRDILQATRARLEAGLP